MLVRIFSLSCLLALSACASRQTLVVPTTLTVAPSATPNIPIPNVASSMEAHSAQSKQKTPTQDPLEQHRWASFAIQNFLHADRETTVVPFGRLTTQFVDESGDEERCSAAMIDVYRQMRQYNPASILALWMLLSCEVGSESEQQVYYEQLSALSETMLTGHDGSSESQAIKIFTLSDAQVILTLAGYTMLDFEIIPDAPHLVYRFHATDDETGQFEYFYFDNFAYMKRIYEITQAPKDARQLSSFISSQFLKSQSTGAVNMGARELIRRGNYQRVVELVEPRTAQQHLTPISRVQLAKAYLGLNQTDKIDALLDDLFDQKDQGDIHAAAFLAELTMTLQSNYQPDQDVQGLLETIDRRTSKGEGAFMLASSYFAQNQSGAFDYWFKQTLKLNPAYQRRFASLTKASEGPMGRLLNLKLSRLPKQP